jgi:transposase InsO family protein
MVTTDNKSVTKLASGNSYFKWRWDVRALATHRRVLNVIDGKDGDPYPQKMAEEDNMRLKALEAKTADLNKMADPKSTATPVEPTSAPRMTRTTSTPVSTPTAAATDTDLALASLAAEIRAMVIQGNEQKARAAATAAEAAEERFKDRVSRKLKDQREWRERELAARGLILDNMNDGYRSMWEKLGDAHTIWVKVETHFKNVVKLERTEVSNKLETVRLGQGASAEAMEQHMASFNLLCQRAEWADLAKTPEQKVEYWVNSLPPGMMSYKYHVKDRKGTDSEDVWSYASSQFALLVQDQRRYDQQQQPAAALAAHGSGKWPARKTDQQENGTGRGRKGGKHGGGPGKGRRNQKGGGGSKPRCYLCDSEAHLARDCPLKDEVKAFVKAKTGNRGGDHGSFGFGATAVVQETKNSGWPGWDSPAGLVASAVEGAVLNTMAHEEKDAWVLDSGCTQSMTSMRDMLTDIRAVAPRAVSGADNQVGPMAMEEAGDCVLQLQNGVLVEVPNVYYWPRSRFNLLSLHQLILRGWSSPTLTLRGQQVTHSDIHDYDGGYLQHADGRRLKFEVSGSGLWLVRTTNAGNHEVAAAMYQEPTLETEHHRLGHMGRKKLLVLAKAGLLRINYPSAKNDKWRQTQCPTCNLSNTIRSSRRGRSHRGTRDAELIHLDLTGPFNPSREGFDHLAVMRDDYSKICAVVPMKGRVGAMPALKAFVALLERQTGCQTRFVRSDNGPELVSPDAQAWYREKGIIHETSPPYSPEHNGPAEAFVKVVKQMARAILVSSGLDHQYWADAARHAAVLYMKINVGSDGVAPWTKLTGRELGLDKMLAFGDACWVYTPKAHLPPRPKSSFQTPKGKLGRILGQKMDSTGWIVLLESGDVVRTADVRAADGASLEASPVSKPYPVRVVPQDEEHIGSEQEDDDDQQDDDQQDDTESPDLGPPVAMDAMDVDSAPAASEKRQKSQRVKHSWTYEPVIEEEEDDTPRGTNVVDGVRRSMRHHDQATLAMFEGDAAFTRPPPIVACVASAAISATHEYDDPRTVREALSGPYAKEWQAAMKVELDKLAAMRTWAPARLPKGRKKLTAKWVLKIKRDAAGKLVKFKARLVARGFMQVQGVDFDETFAPVGRTTSLRILIAIAVLLDWELQQADVEGAYLNGYLDKPIFMSYPEGVAPDGRNDCLLLKRSLYGLKQSGRAWWEELSAGLESIGFRRLESEWGLHFRPSSARHPVAALMLVYVDDLLLATKTREAGDSIFDKLAKLWTITKLGDVSTILGMQVVRDRANRTAHLSQPGYVAKIVERFPSPWLEHKTMPRAPLSKDRGEVDTTSEEDAELTPYQAVVGSLQWLASMSRPDIAFTSSRLATKLVSPTQEDWQKALRVVAYLKGTETHGLAFNIERRSYSTSSAFPDLEGFVDADWAQDPVTRKSTSGYLFKLGGCLISWYSRLQGCVAQSTVEAEYVALAEATKEAMWLRGLLDELGLRPRAPTLIHIDNQGAAKLAFKPAGHGRTKHIETRYHLVRHVVREGVVTLRYIPTAEQPADILTKALHGPRHQELTCKIGVSPETWLAEPSASAWGSRAQGRPRGHGRPHDGDGQRGHGRPRNGDSGYDRHLAARGAPATSVTTVAHIAPRDKAFAHSGPRKITTPKSNGMVASGRPPAQQPTRTRRSGGGDTLRRQ